MFIIKRNGLGALYYAGGGIQHYPGGKEYISNVWTSDPQLATRYSELNEAHAVCVMYNATSERTAQIQQIVIRTITEAV